ncbi:sensor histidine kinase [Desulfogranum japonicum]|uniref:sensor histidine kinase n=1 Tax=Desulfogranum japonicum TaxID=231447 RepID=UPI0004298BD7|nr:ATP-binding protein [Desulfogranum japonicum]
MSSLKFSLSTSIFVLLSIGMILANLVTLVFWHAIDIRKGVRQAQQSVKMVHEILDIDQQDNYRLNKGRLLSVSLEFGGAVCAVMQYRGATYKTGDQQCLVYFSDMLRGGLLYKENKESSVVFTHNPFFAFLAPDSYVYVWLKFSSREKPFNGIGLAIPLSRYWTNLFLQEKVILVYVLFNAMVFSVLIFFRMRRLIMRPLDRLVDLVSHHTLSEKDIFLSYSGTSEFSQLSNALYSMVDRIHSDHQKLTRTVQELENRNKELQETRNDMIKAERLAATGQLTAGLAHEIGNPLGIVLGYVGLLKRKDLQPDEQEEYLNRVEGELERIHRLIQQLLCYCRQVQMEQQRTEFSLQNMIREIVELLQVKCGQSIRFITQFDCQDIIYSSENEIRQTMLNCLLNAVDSFDKVTDVQDKYVYISTRCENDDSGKLVMVIIRDNGVGIEPEMLSKVTEPFFTTKVIGKGTGLGLSVSSAILESEGGSLDIQSYPGKGTTVTIRLPIYK